MLLQDKIVLITGASRGIGRQIALNFADNGAKTVINYFQSQQEANQVAHTIAERTGNAPLIVKADVSVAQDVETMIQTVLSEYGRLDVLVNNAGITVRAKLRDLTEEIWDQVLAVNLKGPFLCSKLASEAMLREGQGKIINISSIRGLTGTSRSLHYSVSKAGLIAMTKSLALELAPHIQVNAIAPGYTFTDLHAHLREDEVAKIESTIPLKRFGTVDDMAGAALFLASSQSDYITGETIVVSGGLVIRT
jgi:3-oxoacyl-[acyl-carrier protein] reductase